MAKLSILLGRRIEEIRKAKNIKQNELAEMIDIEATNLNKLEKGIHLPKEQTIAKIIKALNINMDELFDFKHIQPRKILLEKIIDILNDASDGEIQFFYKVLLASKAIK